MSAVRAARAPAGRRTTFNSRGKQPEVRAKAAIMGYGQNKHLELRASGSHEFSRPRSRWRYSHGEPVYRFLELRDREYRGSQRPRFVEISVRRAFPGSRRREY